MAIRRPFLALTLLLLLPSTARADKHPLEAYVAASVGRGSTLVGFNAAVEHLPLNKENGSKFRGGIGYFLDYSFHSGSADGGHESRSTFFGGVRFSVPTFWGLATKVPKHERGLCPFVQVLYSFDKPRQNVGIGGGFDFLMSELGEAGFRAQADVIFADGAAPFYRASLGLTYRFE